jgi:hypothetical protein
MMESGFRIINSILTNGKVGGKHHYTLKKVYNGYKIKPIEQIKQIIDDNQNSGRL